MRFGTSLLCLLAAGCLYADSDGTVLSDEQVDAHAKCFGYSYGQQDLPQDYARAFEWCSVSAEQGVSHGQTLLAELYHHGRGVPQNHELAAHWYERAAKAGHPHAQIVYGIFLIQGLGVEADSRAGLTWIREAAAQGDPDAEELLQELALRGIE